MKILIIVLVVIFLGVVAFISYKCAEYDNAMEDKINSADVHILD